MGCWLSCTRSHGRLGVWIADNAASVSCVLGAAHAERKGVRSSTQAMAHSQILGPLMISVSLCLAEPLAGGCLGTWALLREDLSGVERLVASSDPDVKHNDDWSRIPV